jgi:hypothetical protein
MLLSYTHLVLLKGEYSEILPLAFHHKKPPSLLICDLKQFRIQIRIRRDIRHLISFRTMGYRGEPIFFVTDTRDLKLGGIGLV